MGRRKRNLRDKSIAYETRYAREGKRTHKQWIILTYTLPKIIIPLLYKVHLNALRTEVLDKCHAGFPYSLLAVVGKSHET